MSAAPTFAPAVFHADVPNVPGTPFGGGFYGGRIAANDQTHALIVSPKAVGQIDRVVWKTDWRAPTPGAQSLFDGFANTEAMLAAGGHPIADWLLQVRLGWFDDAYVPARDELEVLYRNLKPSDYDNWTYANRLKYFGAAVGQYVGVDKHGNGFNASSVPPGKAYTKKTPRQTVAEDFREGGPEAFDLRFYWSSTEFVPTTAWGQTFGDGGQGGADKLTALRARAVRKVLISTSPISLAA